MTPRQSLFMVELPLAAPMILAGIRTATVWVVGTATLSTPIGQTSLGNYIFTGPADRELGVRAVRLRRGGRAWRWSLDLPAGAGRGRAGGAFARRACIGGAAGLLVGDRRQPVTRLFGRARATAS